MCCIIILIFTQRHFPSGLSSPTGAGRSFPANDQFDPDYLHNADSKLLVQAMHSYAHAAQYYMQVCAISVPSSLCFYWSFWQNRTTVCNICLPLPLFGLSSPLLFLSPISPFFSHSYTLILSDIISLLDGQDWPCLTKLIIIIRW